MKSLLQPFRRAFDYSGRSSKREFAPFFWVLWVLIPVPAAVIFPATQGSGLQPGSQSVDWFLAAVGIYLLIVLVPTVSLVVRRLHDSNHSGWWALWMLLSVVGDLAVFAAALSLDGTDGSNRYGADPRIKEQPDKRLRQLGY